MYFVIPSTLIFGVKTFIKGFDTDIQSIVKFLISLFVNGLFLTQTLN